MGKQKDNESTAMTKTEAQLPVGIDDSELAELAGAGNENVTRDDLATPFLLVLQANSPEVKKSDPRCVTGAEEGMLIHSLTKRLYDGKRGLDVIDCYFEPLLLRWRPRGPQGGGGGFKGIIDPADPILKQARPGEKNELSRVLPDGTEVNETNQHYMLVRPAGSDEPYVPVVLGLSSTQIKKSRQLNANISLEKVRNARGELVPIPRFGLVFKLTTVVETKDTNTWFGVHFDKVRRVNQEELRDALGFYKAISAGDRRAKPTAADLDREDAPTTGRSEADGTVDDDIPY
jgi:hypothetical protein